MIKEGLGSGKGKDYKPWLKIQDFPSKGRVTRVKGIKTQSRVNIGSIALYKGQKSLISPSYVIFKIDENVFLPEYIMYFLKSEYGRKQIENFNNGTVRNSLSFDDLGQIKIPKMSKKEQERLVLLISNATSAKTKLYDSYNSLLKIGSPEYSFTKFECDFDEIELGSIIDETSLKDEVDYIELDDEEFEKYRISENDILINRTNSIDLVGKTGLYKWKDNKGIVVRSIYASYLMKITIKPEYSPTYITYYMNLTTIKNEIRKFAFQSNGQFNINLENLKKLVIKFPKDKEVIEKYEKEFDDYCSQLNNLMSLAELLEKEESVLFDRYLK